MSKKMETIKRFVDSWWEIFKAHNIPLDNFEYYFSEGSLHLKDNRTNVEIDIPINYNDVVYYNEIEKYLFWFVSTHKLFEKE